MAEIVLEGGVGLDAPEVSPRITGVAGLLPELAQGCLLVQFTTIDNSARNLGGHAAAAKPKLADYDQAAGLRFGDVPGDSDDIAPLRHLKNRPRPDAARSRVPHVVRAVTSDEHVFASLLFYELPGADLVKRERSGGFFGGHGGQWEGAGVCEGEGCRIACSQARKIGYGELESPLWRSGMSFVDQKRIRALRRRSGAVFGCLLVALILAVALGVTGESRPSSNETANLAQVTPPVAVEPVVEPVKPSPDLVLRVIDAAGESVLGKDVQLKVDFGFGAELLGAPVRTDAEGLARFVRYRELLEKYGTGSALLEVGFSGLAAPPVSLRFALNRVPERVLILVFPDSTGLPASDAAPAETLQETDLTSLFAAEPDSLDSRAPDVAAEGQAGPTELEPSTAVLEVDSKPLEAQPLGPKTLSLASLVGRILVDEEVPLDILRVELDEVVPTGRRRGRIHPAQVLDADGHFRFEAVSPGLSALRVSLWGMAGTLAWVDEIELEVGEQRLDFASCQVDLRGRLFSAEVEVLDEFGLRIEPAVVMPFDLRASGYGAAAPWMADHGAPRVQTEGSTARVWMDGKGLDLVVLAPDCEPQQIHLDPDAEDFGQVHRVAIAKRSVGELELRFLDRELLEGLPPGYQLRAELRRPDGLRYPWDSTRNRGEFDSHGKLRLEPADCGTFAIYLSLVSPDGEVRELARQPDRVEVSPRPQTVDGVAASVPVVHLRGFSSALHISK